ncbi:MAG: 50S ribosomal protein L3 [candidate division KSB1 bacterium]|nr:50S ribosomal protein L3 [candidate division KSB1 bacterium]
MVGLIGRKIGMTRVFDEQGNSIATTVIEAGPCYVTQIKTQDVDGYQAIQLGFQEKREKLTTKPLLGHFNKAGVKPLRVLREFRDFEAAENLKLGDELRADIFSVGDIVAVSGNAKGKGFAGVVKRHGFRGGPKTHGQSDRHRAPGSLGQSSYPSRVFKGLRMAGRMGNTKVTVRNLQVLKVDAANNLIMVKGAVPGAINGIVVISKKTK